MSLLTCLTVFMLPFLSMSALAIDRAETLPVIISRMTPADDISCVSATGAACDGSALSVSASKVPLTSAFGFGSLTRSDIASSKASATSRSLVASGYSAAGDKGAGCIYVLGAAGGPGAVQDALGAWWQLPPGKAFDVTCFGAKMDGSTDDSGSVQAAVNAAATTGVGVTVIIPGGKIKLANITLPANVSLRGAGVNATAVFAAAINQSVVIASYPSANGNIRVSDMAFYGAGGGQQTSGFFVYFKNCNNCRLTDFSMSGAFVGVQVDGSNTVNVSVDHGISNGAKQYHYVVSGGSDTFLDSLITTAGAFAQASCGLQVTQTAGLWISNSDFTASTHGTCVTPSTGQFVKWVFASNTALGDSGNGHGLFINPTGGGLVYGLTATDSWTSGNKLMGVATQCDTLNGQTGVIEGVTITAHRSIANSRSGMMFFCGDGIRVTDPLIVSNSTPLGGGVSGRDSGITFGAGVSHFTVRGGEFRALFGEPAYQKYAVEVQAGASDYYTITGIDALGGTTTGTAISDSGTGKHKSVNFQNWQ